MENTRRSDEQQPEKDRWSYRGDEEQPEKHRCKQGVTQKLTLQWRQQPE